MFYIIRADSTPELNVPKSCSSPGVSFLSAVSHVKCDVEVFGVKVVFEGLVKLDREEKERRVER